MSRRSNVHGLLLTHSKVSVLPRINAVDAERVVLGVELKRLDLEHGLESFVLNLGEPSPLLLHFAVTGARDEVAESEQVVNVPHIVRVLVEVHADGEDALLPVDHFLYDFHLFLFF